MTDDFVFPEDTGTGAGSGDAADAANFASLADQLGEYVASGFTFTYDATAEDVAVSAGKAFLRDTTATAAQSLAERDQGVKYVVEASARSNISLSSSTVNHLFLSIDLSTDDSVTVSTNTTDTLPAAPSLKLGTVDTTDGTTTLVNRGPDVGSSGGSDPTDLSGGVGIGPASITDGDTLSLELNQLFQYDANDNLTSNFTDINMKDNGFTNVNSLQFETGGISPRVMYGGSSGLFVKRAFGTAATLTKQWSPPESQGGKESTLALVVGDDDAYVYDIYNNAGYEAGGRAARWGVSLKHQNSADPRPYIIDFDNGAIGGASNVPRVAINPMGPFEHRNGPVEFNQNPVKGLREVGASPAATDLASGEWAFTTDRDGTGQAAWLYKDSTGTAHYMDTDGTL